MHKKRPKQIAIYLLFEPIKIQTYLAPQNDCLNLSFINVLGKTMARNDQKIAICLSPEPFFMHKTLPLESVQDFLIKLDMKPCMHLVETSIFSLNPVIIRPTNIMNRAYKNWAQFQKIKYISQKSKFSKTFFNKSWSLSIFIENLFWKDSTNF